MNPTPPSMYVGIPCALPISTWSNFSHSHLEEAPTASHQNGMDTVRISLPRAICVGCLTRTPTQGCPHKKKTIYPHTYGVRVHQNPSIPSRPIRGAPPRTNHPLLHAVRGCNTATLQPTAHHTQKISRWVERRGRNSEPKKKKNKRSLCLLHWSCSGPFRLPS
ncbi:hypothetical protein BDP81DRAFT_429346, partial [Colletotrichum phormii]